MERDIESNHEQETEMPLNELLSSPIVDIYTGPHSTHWPLHERLLYHHSPYLCKILTNEHDKTSQLVDGGERVSSRQNKSYSFPEVEDHTFTLFVGWLYNRPIPCLKIEKDVDALLNLYLLAQKLQIDRLSTDVIGIIREHYHSTSSYPGLRHVQFVYKNTDSDNGMRQILISFVARHFATTERIPMHWAIALQQNRQLANDVICWVQRYNIKKQSVPRIHDTKISREGEDIVKIGFSDILHELYPLDVLPQVIKNRLSRIKLQNKLDVKSVKSYDNTGGGNSSIARSSYEAGTITEAKAEYVSLSFLNLLEARLNRPSNITNTRNRNRRLKLPKRTVSFKPDVSIFPAVNEDSDEEYLVDDDDEIINLMSWPEPMEDGMKVMFHKREVAALAVLWVLYLCWIFGVFKFWDVDVEGNES